MLHCLIIYPFDQHKMISINLDFSHIITKGSLCKNSQTDQRCDLTLLLPVTFNVSTNKYF